MNKKSYIVAIFMTLFTEKSAASLDGLLEDDYWTSYPAVTVTAPLSSSSTEAPVPVVSASEEAEGGIAWSVLKAYADGKVAEAQKNLLDAFALQQFVYMQLVKGANLSRSHSLDVPPPSVNVPTDISSLRVLSQGTSPGEAPAPREEGATNSKKEKERAAPYRKSRPTARTPQLPLVEEAPLPAYSLMAEERQRELGLSISLEEFASANKPMRNSILAPLKRQIGYAQQNNNKEEEKRLFAQLSAYIWARALVS